MLRIFHGINYDFLKWWKPSAIARIIFIAVGLGLLAVNGMHWSIEFTGGTLIQVEFRTPPGADAVRSAVEGAGYAGAEIQEFGSPTEYTIRAQSLATDSTVGGDEIRAGVESALRQQFGDTSEVKITRSEYVGPRVGAELRQDALYAMLVAFVVTLIYLAIRFEWRFGVAAVLANAHEILATLAFLSIMRLEFSLTVLAALLTVIGYSLNDTIIIFDRVRENLKKHRKASIHELVNRSINETLPRSILTHATTLAATLALLFFAGEILRPFAWVLAFGIFTATLTSIYVSGALLVWIETQWPRAHSTDIRPTSSQGKSGRPPAKSAPAGAGSR